MPLSNTVFTPGNPPDHSAALTQIALNRPNVFKAFSEGYDQAQKRQIALEQYKQAKMKTDLAAALYPDLLRSQQAALQARLGAFQNPTNYQVQPTAVTPISTAPSRVAVTNQDGTTTVTTPSDPGIPPKVYHPDNPFQGSAPGLFTPPASPTPMIPGVAGDSGDYGDYVADASPYSAGDFGA